MAENHCSNDQGKKSSARKLRNAENVTASICHPPKQAGVIIPVTRLPQEVGELVRGFLTGKYDTLYVIVSNGKGVKSAGAGDLPDSFLG